MSEFSAVFSYLRNYYKFTGNDIDGSFLLEMKRRATLFRSFGLLVNFFEKFPLSRETDVLFVGLRFPDLILAVSRVRMVSVLNGGIFDVKWCLQHRISWKPAWSWERKLYELYVGNSDIVEQESRLEKLVLEIQACLVQVSPKVIVFWNDSLFVERAIILAANNLGIPTVNLQDGYFGSSTQSHIIHGHFADYMLVWGDYFKDIFVEKRILPVERVRVLGYPFLLSSYSTGETLADSANLKVCFLGQPYEKYDKRFANSKDSVIRNVMEACKSLGLCLIYRPHPGENRFNLADKYPNIILTKPFERLEETFKRHQIFLSIGSTALMEASLRGRFAAQILEKALVLEDFETIGICPSVANDVEKISFFLDKVRKREIEFQGASPEFMSIPPDLGEKFIEVLGDLEIEA